VKHPVCEIFTTNEISKSEPIAKLINQTIRLTQGESKNIFPIKIGHFIITLSIILKSGDILGDRYSFFKAKISLKFEQF
jgi:hypothetical protein